ncbi:terpene synthase family protein [Actinopolyspora sp. H202]|uniref:terpene synthase family protein n=1 Tax=Actinopolyspora sp. H202 TaxID=1500456 RepID=UPI003EE5A994
MRPFELPDFYTPHPARLNPHVDSARTHTTRWARETGLLSRPRSTATATTIPDETEFDDHDYALLAGYTHPDVSTATLNLLADWYAWMFLLDDQLPPHDERPGSSTEARRDVQRLLGFLRTTAGCVPEPNTPLERGLAELWQRTAATTTPRLLRRLAAELHILLTARVHQPCRPLESFPNPVDHLRGSRHSSGARWVATLVEYPLGSPLPLAVARSRPLRLLRECFADALRLCNDLFSYQRETRQERKRDNTVLSVERFLECSPQRAAEIANTVLTRRVHLFEITLHRGLPALLSEHELPEQQRTTVLTYVNGMRDWLAGAHEWHSLSTRYMNTGPIHTTRIRQPAGLGFTATGHNPRPVTTTGSPMESGRFRPRWELFPWSTRSHDTNRAPTNPLLTRLRSRTASWAQRHGSYENAFPSTTRTNIDYALLAARVLPHAGETELALIADWTLWARWINDGAHRERYQPWPRLAEFMAPDPTKMPSTSEPAEQALAELWTRTTTIIPKRAQPRFRQRIRKFLRHTAGEPFEPGGSEAADLLAPLETPPRTARSHFRLALTELRLGPDIPPKMVRSPAMRSLRQVFAEITTLHRDLVIAHRRSLRENPVATIPTPRRPYDGRRHHAVSILTDLLRRRQQRFESLLSRDIAGARAEYRLSPTAGRQLDSYLDDLERWITGELGWLLETEWPTHHAAPAPQVAQRPLPTTDCPTPTVDVFPV